MAGVLGRLPGSLVWRGFRDTGLGALVSRCPLELAPSGPASTLSDFVCITHTEQKCRLAQGRAGGGGVQCGNAGGCLMLHFGPCSSQLSATSISQSSPSTAGRLILRGFGCKFGFQGDRVDQVSEAL